MLLIFSTISLNAIKDRSHSFTVIAFGHILESRKAREKKIKA